MLSMSTAQLVATLHRVRSRVRAAHRESSCSPSCGTGERHSSAAKLAAAPPSDARQRMAMSMSIQGHQHLGERHAGQAGSHADAKVRYTMLAVLLVVSEPLTANALPISKSEIIMTRGVTPPMR